MSDDINDSTGFIISAPDLQAGLSAEIERGVRPQEFLNRYHADYEVRCAFCVGHTPHRKGFTVRLKDGRKALCGFLCAQEFFGKEVAFQFEKELERQIDYENMQSVLARTVDGAPEALKLLRQEWVGIEKSYISAVRGIKAWVDHDILQQDLSDGALVLRRYRTFWRDTVARDGKEIRKKETIEEVQARIPGADCLLQDGRPFGLAEGGLAALAHRAGDPGSIKGKVVNELMGKRRAIIDSLESGLRFSQCAYAFFQEENLKNFTVWYGRRFSGGCPEIRIDKDRRLSISNPDPSMGQTLAELPDKLPSRWRLLELLGRKPLD
jgi:hypothetical protein